MCWVECEKCLSPDVKPKKGKLVCGKCGHSKNLEVKTFALDYPKVPQRDIKGPLHNKITSRWL